MKTSLERATRIPPTDAALVKALAKVDVPSDAAQSVSIGVQDPEGEVYRVVNASGLCEAVRIFESARLLGFDIGNADAALADRYQKVLRHPAAH